MRTRFRSVAWAIVPLMTISSARAQSRGHSGHGRHGGTWHHATSGLRPSGHGPSPVTINPGYGSVGVYPPFLGYYPPISSGWGPYLIAPPTVGPVMPPMAMGEPSTFVPPIAPAFAAAQAPDRESRPVRRNAARSKELMTIGDRLFRAGNLIRAVERYEQSIRADPDRAEPRARLAQVALSRGKYREAANALREAQAAEPGWLATAGDVQALYPEPAEFARLVAKLEAHLQARPEDRDGWLVLGALWYLSGRTQKAADVFLRLSDRKADPTLRAFLAATKAGDDE